MSFPARAYSHCRGDFPTGSEGFAFGGGRGDVGNIKAPSAKNAAAMAELLDDESVGRMATYPIRKLPKLYWRLPAYSL
jgi:hypothetical protein